MENEYLKDEYIQVLFTNVILYCITNAKLLIKLEKELIIKENRNRSNEIIEQLIGCGDEKYGSCQYYFEPIDKNILKSFKNLIEDYQKNNIFNFRSDKNNYFIDYENKLFLKLSEIAQKYKNDINR